MRRYQRRRLLSAWSLPVLLAVGCIVTALWKFGWLPVKFGGTETGTIALHESDASDPATGRVATSDQAIKTVETDVIFKAQSEPPISADDRGMTGGAATDSATALHREAGAHQWDDPSTPRIFPGLPASRNMERSSYSAEQANTGVVTASNDVAARAPSTSATQGIKSRPHDAAKADPVPKATERDLQRIDRLIESGDTVAGHRELSQIYWYKPDLRQLISERLEASAQSIYFSPQPHFMEPHVVQLGDQLRKIAAKYHISWEYLAHLNRIDPRRIRPGQKLKVIMGPFAAFVDLSDHELTIHAHGYFVRKYPVGIGKDTSSPIGRFRVLNKVVNPQYTDPQGRVVDADDPANPLGERWIDIGDGFGIHGTNNEGSIGRNESRGCVRMLNSDVAQVYGLLVVGSEVVIQR